MNGEFRKAWKRLQIGIFVQRPKGSSILRLCQHGRALIAVDQCIAKKKKVAIFPVYLYNIGIISTREGIV